MWMLLFRQHQMLIWGSMWWKLSLDGWGGWWCANPFSCQTQLSWVKLRLSWGCDNKHAYKISWQSVYVRMQGEHLAWLCMQRHCMSTITHDKCSCVHAHERILWKIRLENRKYVGSLSIKFEKDLFRGFGEICLSLEMHVYLHFFFVFSAIFQVKVPSTRTTQNYDNPFGIFGSLVSIGPSFSRKNDTFYGQESYF